MEKEGFRVGNAARMPYKRIERVWRKNNGYKGDKGNISKKPTVKIFIITGGNILHEKAL